ncbi:hypothetical protein TNCT6_72560 [Streptomyces sp. 6-11-2]|nr:hypothetical protein TNCT6_72560 [Streptomyces sp. 6-11-2]
MTGRVRGRTGSGQRDGRTEGRKDGRTEGRNGMTAKQLLAVEAALVGGLVLAVLVKEMPGLLREIRIWRMSGRGSGHAR